MTTRRRQVAAGITAVALAAAGILGVQLLAGETCVTVYEDYNGVNDTMSVCSTTPGNVKIANLTTTTAGLHGGCNRTVNQSSTWNDCISSMRGGNLPTNYRVRWYLDANYSNLGYCQDTNGSFGPVNMGGGTAERISSFRIEGGNCP